MVSGKVASILLVEDNEIDSEAVRRAFKKLGINNTIVSAKDGQSALEKLREMQTSQPLTYPTLTLLDLNMPRMNGIEFLRHIRTDPELANNVVFVLTTSDLDEDKEAAYSLGISGYLVKDKLGEGLKDFANMMEGYLDVVEFPPPAGTMVQ